MNPDMMLDIRKKETASTKDSSLTHLFRSNLKPSGAVGSISEESSNLATSPNNKKLSFSSFLTSFGSSVISSNVGGQGTAENSQRPDFVLIEKICMAESGDVLRLFKTKPEEELLALLDKSRTILMYAALRREVEILQAILKRFPDLISKTDEDGRSALHYAVLFSNLEAVQYLIGQNADVKVVDSQRQNPAHLAAVKNNLEVFLLLVAKGCDLQAVDCYGLTPVDYLKDEKLKTDMLSKLQPAQDVQHTQRCINLKKTILNKVHLLKYKCPWQALRKTEEVTLSNIPANEPQENLGDSPVCPSHQPPSCKQSPSQTWVIEDVLATGNFGTVYCGKRSDSEKLIAIKELSKRQIRTPELTKRAFEEKKAMELIKSPFVIRAYDFFQTEKKLYLTMEYFPKRDLGRYLQYRGTLCENELKILAAELILAIETIHSHNFIHRDIKPDNILISETGHISICDFGLCKQLKGVKNEKTATFCGTLCYLPPEILGKKQYGKEVDWYLMGETLFECAFGAPPFFTHCNFRMKALIQNCELQFPKEQAKFSLTFIQFLRGLIGKDPCKRLGVKYGACELKRHPFFLGVDWARVACQRVPLFDASNIEDLKPKSRGQLLKPVSANDNNSLRNFTLTGWAN